MYLKSIEMIGFKSFADKTKLDFEPGLTAIVGPNGCGKSNIADAVRWVLGEQSAKALRGTQMVDCIFNGTDAHKPMGMAEVSLTLADCEQKLGTEYNEVTITRRVYRSAEGEYFINRVPCRLKDIQRLFMDTGIGTDAYSLMEQGRIDQILSSRPEDRREVFEEASGITRYKADKREALRKLDQTEANLLRLADIIREVRRQIISLQRQAGKARRYKALQEQLRSFDLYAARERLAVLDRELSDIESRRISVAEQNDARRADLEAGERETVNARADLDQAEQAIRRAVETALHAQNELERVRERIRVNGDRIRDLTGHAEQERAEGNAAAEQAEKLRAEIDALKQHHAEAEREREEADAALATSAESLAQCEAELEQARQRIRSLRTEQVDLESRLARLQNEQASLEAEERNGALRKERLAAEQSGLQRQLELFADRERGLLETTSRLRAEVVACEERHNAALAQQAEIAAAMRADRETLSSLKEQCASCSGQMDILRQNREAGAGYPAGTRALLQRWTEQAPDPNIVLGPLAEQLQPEPSCRAAFEAVVRAWMDAIVVRDEAAALDLLRSLRDDSAGSVRLLAVEGTASPSPPPPAVPGEPLLQHLRVPETLRPLAERLFGSVWLVQRLEDFPTPLSKGWTFVTPDGVLAGEGRGELWKPEADDVTPLSLQQKRDNCAAELAAAQENVRAAEARLAALTADADAADRTVAETGAALDQARIALASAEGEHRVLAQESRKAREHAETVGWELQALIDQTQQGSLQRQEDRQQIDAARQRQDAIRVQLAEETERQQAVERDHQDSLREVADRRVLAGAKQQAADRLAERLTFEEQRWQDAHAQAAERRQRAAENDKKIQALQAEMAAAEQQLQPLEALGKSGSEAIAQAEKKRDEQLARCTSLEAALRDRRTAMEQAQAELGRLDVERAEQRMRRNNLMERVTSEHRVSAEEITKAPEPAWEDGQKPDRDALETLIAELRAKLDAMGAVNLVAIEEHAALEERHTFLVAQQDDLVKAKAQLMDLIRRINKTTTEMFSATFAQVNANFQELFRKLFGGGAAKLVLVDETDVLESGIEIIARPPGKKLQSVSLMSGGERTMTAVALLFALYQVKPSPFCVLDEIDAALDEANIGRFIHMVQGFLKDSQFILITHNRQTIAAAHTLYGITMQQQGISTIVSVRLNRPAAAPVPAQAETTAAPPASN